MPCCKQSCFLLVLLWPLLAAPRMLLARVRAFAMISSSQQILCGFPRNNSSPPKISSRCARTFGSSTTWCGTVHECSAAGQQAAEPPCGRKPAGHKHFLQVAPLAVFWWLYVVSGVTALRFLNVPMYRCEACCTELAGVAARCGSCCKSRASATCRPTCMCS